ncbi:DUF3810 domain-containing protein [Panacibacter ginsenosidivorans]|nr:DUF3810 domain-containing protein [Panacibacter ginsenosidivorans]
MDKNKGKRAWLKLIIPLAIAVSMSLISGFPALIEKYYTGYVYPVISTTMRFLFGWLPFSIGDLLYLSAAIWLIVRFYKTGKAVLKKRVSKESFLRSLRRTVAVILWIYIIFYSFWGLNYSRLGISYQLKLEPVDYSTNDLKILTASLITKVNASRLELGDSVTYPSNKEMFSIATSAYNRAEQNLPFLHYKVASIKSSMWGWLGNYTGFLGYYNPFSAEAQVNTTVPRFVIPFTVCHEIGHQLGYGSEDEANFSGYLAAMSSTDERFHYSAYFDLFNYANRELFIRDSFAARANYKLLDTLVKKDIQTYKKFIIDHKNPIEPLIDKVYGKYLVANNQPNGLDTYDEVVGWLIAYKKNMENCKPQLLKGVKNKEVVLIVFNSVTNVQVSDTTKT